MNPYNHTISKHVNMPKQPITAAVPRPTLPVFTAFAPPVKAEMVGPLLVELVELGRLFVKPAAVTAVGKETLLLMDANWLVASAVLLAYTDTIWVVEVCVEVRWLTGAMYVMK